MDKWEIIVIIAAVITPVAAIWGIIFLAISESRKRQTNASSYCSNCGKPVDTMTQPITKTKRRGIKTSLPCPACGKPISFMPIGNGNNLWPWRDRCDACKAEFQLCMRSKFLVRLLIIGIAIVMCACLFIALYPADSVIIAIAFVILLAAECLYISLFATDRLYYLKELKKPENPPFRNQQSQ